MIKIFKKNKTINGYAIFELLFYIAFFSVLSLVAINAIIMMTSSFKETAIQSELAQSGTIMEKMSREIRRAYDISSISATNIILNTKDDDGANKTVEFSFLNSNVELLENGALVGNLNAPNIIVSGLIFTQITTVKGKAVKILLTLKSNNDKFGRFIDFYDTVVLRDSY